MYMNCCHHTTLLCKVQRRVVSQGWLILKVGTNNCIPVVAHQGRTLPLSSHNGAITDDWTEIFSHPPKRKPSVLIT
jgi:hypothetical protein